MVVSKVVSQMVVQITHLNLIGEMQQLRGF